MPRPTTGEEEWENRWPSPDGHDDEVTLPCPYCRREILEEAQRCPYCERYISREDAPSGQKPWWLIVGVVACLLVVFFWIIKGDNVGMPLAPEGIGLATLMDVLVIVAALVVALVLAQLLFARVFGVSLLCYLGLHRWRKELVGQGRDARHVIKCKGCEALKNEE